MMVSKEEFEALRYRVEALEAEISVLWLEKEDEDEYDSEEPHNLILEDVFEDEKEES